MRVTALDGYVKWVNGENEKIKIVEATTLHQMKPNSHIYGCFMCLKEFAGKAHTMLNCVECKRGLKEKEEKKNNKHEGILWVVYKNNQQRSLPFLARGRIKKKYKTNRIKKVHKIYWKMGHVGVLGRDIMKISWK